MRIDRVREFLQAVPFRPFRLFLSNGSSYHVPHPDFVYFGRDLITITKVRRRDLLPRLVATCKPLHVTHVEIIEAR